jgi:molecular chaperone GrpE
MSEQENVGAAEPLEEEVPAVEANGEVRAEPSAPAPGDEAAALRERHLRLAAEFDNYRKRVERERAESWVRAQAQLLERLLEPLDDLQRIAHQEVGGTSATAFQEGAAMVEKKFLRVLEAIGVEEIEAEGRDFDPTIHEALTTVPAESEEEDGTVAQVYQKGYLLKGVLLRPARVVVRKHG